MFREALIMSALTSAATAASVQADDLKVVVPISRQRWTSHRDQIFRDWNAHIDSLGLDPESHAYDDEEHRQVLFLIQLDLLAHTAHSRQAGYTIRLASLIHELTSNRGDFNLPEPLTQRILYWMKPALELAKAEHESGPVADCHWCARTLSESEWGGLPHPYDSESFRRKWNARKTAPSGA
jgi:hypothetical protein